MCFPTSFQPVKECDRVSYFIFRFSVGAGWISCLVPFPTPGAVMERHEALKTVRHDWRRLGDMQEIYRWGMGFE